jgi:DtxR family transcriptional regulator, manganese transport regulator
LGATIHWSEKRVKPLSRHGRLLATRRLGVSAIKNIARLKRAGFATARPYRGVFLTEKGEAMAERVRIRHRLVVDVLCALGVPTESAEADAEGIEHHVSETTLKAFALFLKSRR